MTAPTKSPRVFTVTQTAALLGISRGHAYELVARGELKHLRLGRRIVIPRQALDALFNIDLNPTVAS